MYIVGDSYNVLGLLRDVFATFLLHNHCHKSVLRAIFSSNSDAARNVWLALDYYMHVQCKL